MPNTFAYVALFVWPLMSIVLYRKVSIRAATFWAIVGGYMFLPNGITLSVPGFPSFEKAAICGFSALVGCAFKKNVDFSMKGIGVTRYIFAAIMISPWLTVYFNSEPIYWPYFFNGMSIHDAIALAIRLLLSLIFPFFIGWKLFRTFNDQLLLFKLFVIAALLYSLLVLFEIRFSPQLNTWLYGYYSSSFLQSARDGGFRASVFMGHGLLVSIFLSVAVICAAGLWKNRIRTWRIFSPATVLFLLFTVLVLNKSVAAMVYAIVAFFSIKFLSFRAQHSLAVVIVLMLLLYPMSYLLENSPQKMIFDTINSYSPERAESLNYRFENEKMLFKHAQERIFFGWGQWGRNRLFVDGKDISTTDGNWIITLGVFGLLGYLPQFSLLVVPAIRAHFASRKLNSKPEQTLLAAHAILVSLLFVDQIPNSSLNPWMVLIFGALLGRSQYIIEGSAKKKYAVTSLGINNFSDGRHGISDKLKG